MSTRPEGVILAALVLAGSCWVALLGPFPTRLAPPSLLRSPRGAMRLIAGLGRMWPQLWRRLALWLLTWAMPYLLTLLVALLPYVALNIAASGHVLPTTFYAKSVTSSIGGSFSLRFQVIGFYVWLLVMQSPVLVALGAFAAIHWLLGRHDRAATRTAQLKMNDMPGTDSDRHSAQQRASGSLSADQEAVSGPGNTAPQLAALLWLWPVMLVLAYSGSYTGVAYRYLVPGLPPLLVLAAVGVTPALFSRRRIVAIVGLLSLSAVAMLSDVRGVQAYSETVTSTNQCSVADAIWIRDHIPPDALLATHDVGAIGYFDQNRLVDIAGLVTPQIIPLLNNERAIEAYLQSHHVKYVMMWKIWFPPPALIAHQYANRIVFIGCGGDFALYDTNW